jgi:glycosyltransferase involved in cell wall biosynthesis
VTEDRTDADIVDIMVPAYGDGPLLRETLASVIAQEDPRWRLTVLDDAAEQGSRALADWVEKLADERVRYLPNEHRLGINRNFQRCVDEAKADLVVLLGADDRLLPHFVRRARELAALHPTAAWFHTGAAVIDGAGEPALPLADRMKRFSMPAIRDVRVMGGEELTTSLLHGNWMYFPSCVFRREFVARHGFRLGYDIVLDLDLFVRMLLDGGEAVLVEPPCIEYRRHAASLSSSGAEDGTRFAEETAYFAETAAVLDARGWSRAARAARLHWTSRLHGVAKLPGLLAVGEFATARQVLRLAAIPGGSRAVTTGGTR